MGTAGAREGIRTPNPLTPSVRCMGVSGEQSSFNRYTPTYTYSKSRTHYPWSQFYKLMPNDSQKHLPGGSVSSAQVLRL